MRLLGWLYGAGCALGLLHSLACNWHSFSCSRGCLSRTQPEALGLCCLWTSRLLHIRALLGPTHTPSRGCLWSRTRPRLCCLWTRACFTPGPYSTLHIHLAAAYGPAHDHVCVAYGPAPASYPGLTQPYTYTFSRLLMVPHMTTSVLLMDPRLLYVQARTGPETPCPGILCPLLCYSASCSHPAPYKPKRSLCVL